MEHEGSAGRNMRTSKKVNMAMAQRLLYNSGFIDLFVKLNFFLDMV